MSLPSCVCLFREDKKSFIRSKYEKRRYAIVTCADIEDRRQDLKQAILTRDISALLQVYAEGIDFAEPLPDMVSYQQLGARRGGGQSSLVPIVDKVLD